MVTRGRRQPFDCGHKGFGKICHRCQTARNLEAEALKLKKQILAGNAPKEVQTNTGFKSSEEHVLHLEAEVKNLLKVPKTGRSKGPMQTAEQMLSSP